MHVTRKGLIAAFGRVWQWWRDEIAALASDMRGRPRVLAVCATGGVLRVDHLGPTGRSDLGALLVDPSAPAAAGRALARLVAEAPGRYDRIEIVPAEGRGLRRRLTLPLAARDSLHETLRYDIDRQTPFSEDQVYFAVAPGAIDRKAGTLEATLDVVLRREVDPAAEVLRSAGLAPDAVRLAPGTGPDLAPAHLRRGSPRWLGWAMAVAAVAVVLFGALAVHLPRAHALAALAEARDETRAARREAVAVQDLIGEAERLAARETALIERKRTGPAMLDLLAEATARLPDQAFATALEIADGRIAIAGYAAGASPLLGMVEASPAFRDARFSDAVFPDGRLGRERFALTASLVATAEGSE